MEELTEELRQSEKSAYEKLIRMMSHEVNNSVGSANSLLHSCLNYKDQLSDEDRKDFETALNVHRISGKWPPRERLSMIDQVQRSSKSIEIRIKWRAVLIHFVFITPRSVGLPHLDQRAAYRFSTFVQ